MVLAFLFLLAGALRLARFNANLSKISSDYFQGLPIPFGAMSLVGFILLSIDIEAQFNLANFPALIFLYIFFYSVLMISNVPFPSFKKSEWAKHHVKLILLMIFLLLASIAVYEERIVVVIITLYVVGSFAYYLSHRAHFKGIFSGEKKTEIH
jgi:CDP-diacylglycerol--serine O-phosphatidyltransferase